MSALRLIRAELARFTSGPVLRRLVPLALLLIPTLYGVLYLWSNWDPFGHMRHVPVAVVNLDRPTTVDVPSGKGQRVAAGDDFVAELRKDTSLDWYFVDAQTAAKGVEEGHYMFSVTVPEDFSTRLASPLTQDPRQARLIVRTDDANGYIASTKIAETAQKELQAKIDSAAFKAYTEGVLGSLMDMRGQLSDAASGARQLADGSGRASSGAAQLASGTSQLSAGANQLATGAGQLADGTGQLANATGQLVDGTGRLAGGAGDLRTGSAQLADGAAQVSAGTQQLVDVLNGALGSANAEIVHFGRLVTSEAQGLRPLTGAAGVVAGRVAADTGKLHDDLVQLCAQLPNKTPQQQRICAELDQLTLRVQQNTTRLADALRELDAKLATAGELAPRDLGQLVELLTQGTQAIVPLAHATSVISADLHNGTSRVLALVKQLPNAPPELIQRLTEVDTLADQANQAQHHVEDGVGHLLDLLRDLAVRVPGLIAKIEAGLAQVELLNSGAGQVAAGAAQLAGGAAQLFDGADQLASGATQLVDGAGQLVDGATQVSSGAGQLRDGLGQAVPATQQLAAGLVQLKDGSTRLADGLASGAAQIPVLDDRLRARAAEVLSEPVGLTVDDRNPAKLYGRGLAPFFFSIALWVFGLIAFQMLRAANPRALAGQTPAPAIAFGGWAPAALLGAGGATVLYGVTQLGLKLDAVHPWGTLGLMILGVGSFAAIAHLLRLAFGVVGELLTLVLLMLQLTSSGGLYPLQTAPAPFRALHPLLPMTYLVDGLRVTISGGLGAHLRRDVLVLLGYLVGALLLSTFVVIRQRRWSMSRLHPAIEM